ncbi:MAG: PEP-CTERM sorting domain-containing protein [Anaerolineaceae bacterium]|nr:PEP-CTERM sorting domain-containing protein [Anaerolineaceae bacterium]
MKKTIIAIAVLGAVGLSAYGQGTVAWANSNGTKVSTNSVVGGAATGAVNASGTAGGINFYYTLFYSTTQTSVAGNTAALVGNTGTYAFNASGWTDGLGTGNYGTNAAAGRIQSSNPNADGSTSLAGIAGGTAANWVVVAWSANIGSTISALQSYLANNGPMVNGWVGESVVGSGSPGTLGSTPAGGIFGASSPFIPGFTAGLVVPVPEPGTLALAALGGASLLLFRRKK